MSYETESRSDGRAMALEKLGPRCIAIIGVLRENPDGLTAYEINQRLRMDGLLHSTDPNTVRPRLTELKKAEIIESCGRRESPSGCKTTVWRLKERS